VPVVSGQPIANPAVVTTKGVDGTGLGEPPKLTVDGGDPHPKTLRSEVDADTTVKLGGAEKSVGSFQNLQEGLIARSVSHPQQHPYGALTASVHRGPRSTYSALAAAMRVT
jgi:hypothetical protein